MAQIKLAEYTFDNSVGDCLPVLTPNTITMTTEDSVNGTTTRRIVYIDNVIMPTQISFKQQTALSTLDYLNIDKNITSFANMFYQNSSLTYINTFGWDTSNVTSMSSLFERCSQLTTIDLSHCDLKKVESLYGTFCQCSALETLHLPTTFTTSLNSLGRTFWSCSKLSVVTGLSEIDTSKVSNFDRTFDGATSLAEIDLSKWNTSSATGSSSMFGGWTSDQTVYYEPPYWSLGTTTLNSNINWVINVTRNNGYWLDMSAITGDTTITLYNENNLPTEEIFTDWGDGTQDSELTHTYSTAGEYVVVSNLQIGATLQKIGTYTTKAVIYYYTSPSNLFFGFNKMTEAVLTDHYVELVNKKKPTSFDRMFYSTKLQKLPNNLKKIDTSSATSMNLMFYGFQSLTEQDIDLTWMNVSSVTNMSGMFEWSTTIKSLNTTGWNTSKVQNMSNMFHGAKGFTNLDLSHWDVSSCTTMSGMFNEATALTSLDVSSWNTSSVTNMSSMFRNCPVLKTIGMLYSNAESINKLVELHKPNGLVVYYYDADSSQLTPVEGVTFKKYAMPTTIQLPPHIQLHSLPNGVRDELDLKTGILTRYVGIDENNSFYELSEPTTEKIILNHDNSCDYGVMLPTGVSDHYDVVTKQYTQNVGSVFLDGANSWDSMKEFNNTIKFCATGGTVGVDNLNMKGVGGLYCDNDLFPNINDDSDTEHCRVDENGNKFYIFVNKKRLMSPDLIGWQVWLQENKFTMWYELEEPIILTKKYDELDAEKAKWGMIKAYRNGQISYSSNNEDGFTLYPTMKYVAQSANSFNVPMLKPETTYTVYATNTINDCKIDFGNREEVFTSGSTYTSKDTNRITFNNCDQIDKIVVVEGNTTNLSVPHFTGHIDVVNPKVKVVGKNEINMADYKLLTTPLDGSKIISETSKITMIAETTDTALWYDVYLQKDTQYTLSYSSNLLDVYVYDMYDDCIDSFSIVDKSDSGAVQNVSLTFTSPLTSFVRIKITSGNSIGTCILNDLVLNKGNSASYEQYKENVVVANTTIRGIGSVKDELNLGSKVYNLTRRIKEVALTGEENWNTVQDGGAYYIASIALADAKIGGALSSNQYATYSSLDELAKNFNGICMGTTVQYLYLSVAKELIGVESITLDVFKDYIAKTKPIVKYELSSPVTTTVTPTIINHNGLNTGKIVAFEQGSIVLNSETNLAPNFNYSLPSANSFYLAGLKTGTRYTLKYPSASGTISIGNISYNITSNSMLFMTPLTLTGDTSSIVFSDPNPQDVILIEGVYNNREIPYFRGLKSVSNPVITVVDGLTGEETKYRSTTDLELRSLPNGISDKLDIVRGKLTRVVGYRPYENGDENTANVWTDGYNTAYALTSPTITNIIYSIPKTTHNATLKLSSDDLIPQLNYRAASSNNFSLDLLQPNTTYTLYANTLAEGGYSLGGTHSGIFRGTEVISLGETTNNLLTFEGDLDLSNVMLIKGNSINATVPYFRGLKSVSNATFKIEGHDEEVNTHVLESGLSLRSLNNGMIQDTIDMKSCTLTQNLGEIRLIGTESWSVVSSLESVDSEYVLFGLTRAGIKDSKVTTSTCDRFNHVYLRGELHAQECIYCVDNQIRICVKQKTINGNTINALKSWLNQNNTTVIYALATPVTRKLNSTWTMTPITSYDTQTSISTIVEDSLKPMINVTIATTTLEQTVSNLEEQNAQLERENLATMMALTEIYEMIYASAPMGMSKKQESEVTSVSYIGLVYAKLIKKGVKTIDQAPNFLKAEVDYALKQV